MSSKFFESSSNLEHAQYFPSTKKLIVTFRGGTKYQYENVPESVFEGLCDAPSAGGYFGTYIRHDYEGQKIEFVQEQT